MKIMAFLLLLMSFHVSAEQILQETHVRSIRISCFKSMYHKGLRVDCAKPGVREMVLQDTRKLVHRRLDRACKTFVGQARTKLRQKGYRVHMHGFRLNEIEEKEKVQVSNGFGFLLVGSSQCEAKVK